MWYVTSRSGVATLRTAIHLLLSYLLNYSEKFQPRTSAVAYRLCATDDRRQFITLIVHLRVRTMYVTQRVVARVRLRHSRDLQDRILRCEMVFTRWTPVWARGRCTDNDFIGMAASRLD